jgi:serine/threonine-protein kinase
MVVHQCPTCGKQLDPGTRFCPEDGTPLTDTAAATNVKTPATPRSAKKDTLQLPVVVGGRYRVTEFRGGGGMARVYRATDLTLEREVAVKLINPELRAEPEFDARFQREARIASQLADPHIVVVHDFGLDHEHGPYLVMEYLQGQTLRERLQSEGKLPFRAAVQLSAQLMLALIHAHSKNIVHRDIKPDNIFFLNQSGVRLHVRVLDFGIARIYRGDDTSKGDPLTQPGAVLGTPRYMSPEQLAGMPVDARSDLYSAAMVIHEALTGHLPHITGKSLPELCPDAPPSLCQLLEQCLKQNLNERPASAVEVYLRLQELGKASGILLLPPGAMEKLLASQQRVHDQPTITYHTPGAKKNAWVWRGLLLAGLAAAAGGVVYGLMNWLR